MRVAWDLQAVTGPRPTGLGVSVGFLLDACQKHSANMQIVGLRPNEENRALIGVPDRLKWEQWRLPRELYRRHRMERLDLCYSPALGAPLNSPARVVAHVHDLIPLVYPRQFTGFAGWYWKSLLPYTWRRCRALTVSNATVADDICEYLQVKRSKIHVVPYYADPGLQTIAAEVRGTTPLSALYEEPDPPHFITLASHEPRKNIELAISALGLLHGMGIKAGLTCAGGRTPHTESLVQLASKAGVEDYVKFPGYMERDKVVRLMLSATALLFVSRYEGYGMPPLEAMSVGCPVVLSNLACHRQVYGFNPKWEVLPEDLRCTPRFVLPDNVEGLAAEMRRLVRDASYRRALIDSGLAYSALFTPEATAKALTQAFIVAMAT